MKQQGEGGTMKPPILSDVEAILKVSGIAAAVPYESKGSLCHSVAIDITNHYSDLIQQAKAEVAREIFEEIKRERFSEPQHIPEAGKEPVIICLTESMLQSIESKYTGGKK